MFLDKRKPSWSTSKIVCKLFWKKTLQAEGPILIVLQGAEKSAWQRYQSITNRHTSTRGSEHTPQQMLVTRCAGLFIREGWVEALSFTTQLFEELLNCVFIIYHAITSAHSWGRKTEHKKTEKRQLQFNRHDWFQMDEAGGIQVRMSDMDWKLYRNIF